MTKKIVIIGGGIVGFATGLKLQEKEPNAEISIIEKENEPACHQTGNNSGVIHSGIYYKPGSLKAINCKKGYDSLLEFCNQNQIEYELCGKLIVATNEQEIVALEKIQERGVANGLADLKLLGKQEILEIEPYTFGVKAIFVPQTGIVSYKKVAQTMAKLFQERGGKVHYNAKVIGIKKVNSVLYIETEDKTFESDIAVNCAGLYSDKIWEMEQGTPCEVRIIPFRGEYFKIKEDKRYLVKNLIYPVPDPAFPFLGVHFTRRIDGEIEAGPNAVLAFKREGYKKTEIDFSELAESLFWPGFIKVASKYWQTGMGEMYRSWSKEAFTKALQKLLPSIQQDDLEPGGAGVRAQACHRDGTLLDDFYIKESDQMVHVLNAPSPAATSSLAIGDTIADIVKKRLV